MLHQFASVKGDDVDTTLIRPSNWNDVHIEPRTASASFTVPAGSSAVIAGPYEVSAGVTVELASSAVLEVS